MRGGIPCRSICISAVLLTGKGSFLLVSCERLCCCCSSVAGKPRQEPQDNNFSSLKKAVSSAGDTLLQFLQNAARSRHLVVIAGSARKQASLFCTFSVEFPLFLIDVARTFNQTRVCVFFPASLRAAILSHLLDQKVAVTIGVLVRHGQGEVFRRSSSSSRSCASQRN